MSNIMHRITKECRYSVNTPDYCIGGKYYDSGAWIINPILPDCDKKFWVIEGDTIREMTQTENNAYLYLHESTVYLIAEKQLLTNVDGAGYEADANAIINPVMPNCDLKYTKVVADVVVEMTLAEQDAVDLSEAIPAKQDAIKAECTAHILTSYPEPIQRSASLRIYSSVMVRKMTIFIADCIAEENRCFDELEAATTLPAVEAITPIFPEE